MPSFAQEGREQGRQRPPLLLSLILFKWNYEGITSARGSKMDERRLPTEKGSNDLWITYLMTSKKGRKNENKVQMNRRRSTESRDNFIYIYIYRYILLINALKSVLFLLFRTMILIVKKQ